MPIIYQKEPAEAAKAMKQGLDKMIANRAFSTPRLARLSTGEAGAPVPVQALPVFTLGLSDLAEGKDASAAVNTGWRYAVKQDDEIVAHGQTIIDPAGKHQFAATNEGPLVEGTHKAIEAAEAQDEIKSGEFEIRFLQVPALYVAALWLVDKSGGRDYAVPVEPAPPPLIPSKLMPFGDLLEFLQEKAKLHMAAQGERPTLGGI
jgi:hypothetical protein